MSDVERAHIMLYEDDYSTYRSGGRVKSVAFVGAGGSRQTQRATCSSRRSGAARCGDADDTTDLDDEGAAMRSDNAKGNRLTWTIQETHLTPWWRLSVAF